MKIKSAIGVFIVLIAAQARADSTILEYSFTSQSLAPTVTTANITGGSFSSTDGTASFTTSNSSPVSSGYTGSTGSYYLNSNHWTSASSNSLQFTITPASGYELDLSSISFGYYTSGTGPSSYSITIGTNTPLTGSITQGSSSWSLVSIPSLTTVVSSATTITVTFSGASSTAGTIHLDDFSLIGNVTLSAVPEPSTYALIGGVAALGLVGIQRFRSRRMKSAVQTELAD